MTDASLNELRKRFGILFQSEPLAAGLADWFEEHQAHIAAFAFGFHLAIGQAQFYAWYIQAFKFKIHAFIDDHWTFDVDHHALFLQKRVGDHGKCGIYHLQRS